MSAAGPPWRRPGSGWRWPGRPAAGIAGYALMGIGAGVLFPLAVAASARGSGEAEAPRSRWSRAPDVGLTAGPATIGLLSDAAGLRQALLMVVALSLVASALAGAGGPRKRPGRFLA